MNLLVVAGIVAGLVILRFLRAGLLAWLVACWLAIYIGVRHGLATPPPQSVVTMYMGIATLAIAAYMGSSRDRAREATAPIVRFIVERRFTPLLAIAAIAVPAAAGYAVYRAETVRAEPPYFARTVHPAPPPSITVAGSEIDLIRADNPYRGLETSDPDRYRDHVRNGRTIYYRNCFYCHGDALGGDGMFAHGLDPIPTNFTDAGILPNFQESFFFWRVAKGGPGMPEEGGPWESAMPRWEQFLGEEEIWDVVLFLYDFTGRKPREVGEFVHE